MKKPQLDSKAGRAAFRRVREASTETGLPLHNIALRYALERFLKRLFDAGRPEAGGLALRPDFKVDFDAGAITLKGGLTMTYAEDVPPHLGRSTGDADLHLAAFPGSMEDYAELLRLVLSRSEEGDYDDGVRFDTDGIVVSRDREERSGGTVTVPLQIGQLWLQVKTDVTFDARPMHERAPFVEYPSILPNAVMDPAFVRRVPWEFMLADKIGAAFENGMFNKRVRDYADMRLLLATQDIDEVFLAETLAATMRFKDLPLPASMNDAPGFSDAYAATRASRWEHEKVNRRFRVQDPLPDIVPWLRDRLQPVLTLAKDVEALPPWAFGPR